MAQTVNHIKGNISLVLMHSGIVNGYPLLCDAHIVLEPHRGTAAFHAFTLTVLFLFLGASMVCVNKLKRTEDLILGFPDRT